VTPQDQIIPYGLCHCGCGGKTTISDYTRAREGYSQGEPKKYISGHHALQGRVDLSAAVPFKIAGVYCRLIPLTQGQFTIVNSDRYEFLVRWKWYAAWNPSTRSFYAVRSGERFSGKKRKTVKMQRVILGLGPNDPPIADHISGETLDNRDKNLRPINELKSAINRGNRANNTSGRKGVNWHKAARKWQAHISADGVYIDLGRYAEFAVACAIREEAEKKYHGEFARGQ
jgi:hypothetical protein